MAAIVRYAYASQTAQTTIALQNPVTQISASALTLAPTVVTGGFVSFTITSTSALPSKTGIKMDGTVLTTTARTATTVSATGYLPPWKTGVVPITLTSAAGDCNCLSARIAPTAVSYDTASRFATQAAFGPREDLIEHIQQTGLEGYIDEQLQSQASPYSTVADPRWQFMQGVLNGNQSLRYRTAWALQILIPGASIFKTYALIPWETKLEAHAFGSYEQILLDAASTYAPAAMLDVPGNAASSDPKLHPNQNFGREIVQLFSLGTVRLNEDGTPKLDQAGNTQPVYDGDTIESLSRVFTGWNFVRSGNPDFTFYGVDWSAPLVATEAQHDTSSKILFGNVVLPAGQTASQDRQQAIEAIFQNENLPPFISKFLIQRFVKSQPSGDYVRRIVQVFKNDGSGVRGNLGAVIKAILLDAEARAGDGGLTNPTDGFIQDPLYLELSALSLLNINTFDVQPAYVPGRLGEEWWFAPTVFSYFSPAYDIPGTSLNSPEFQLLNTLTSVERSQFLWGIASGTETEIPNATRSRLYTNFPTPASMLEALNHMLYHGRMPQSTQDAILAYCDTVSDPAIKLQSAVFLALNDDNYMVVQ
ncbi:DUF1800 family protein [Terriglobus roseus]|nr:DUF1800 family protein [Terriglobus roseus]